MGFEVDYFPTISLDEARLIIHHYDGAIISTKIKANASFLARGHNLKFIARLGSGLDIIDLSVAEQLNIEIIRAAAANANAVVEHVLGMLFMTMIWLYCENRGRLLQDGYMDCGRMSVLTGQDKRYMLESFNLEPSPGPI